MTGATFTPSDSTLCLQLLVTISWEHQQHPLQALVDSGAAGNFLDFTLANSLHLPIISLDHSLSVTALDGRPLGKGTVTHITAPVVLTVLENHNEKIQFYLIHSPEFPVVLGFPWLSHHSPHINWSLGTVVEWGPKCKSSCLLTRAAPSVPKPPSSLELSQVPSMYHELSEVFSKRRATALPPHRPFDCAIDLLPGSFPPRGRIFSLSSTETQAMEDYIKRLLESHLFVKPEKCEFHVSEVSFLGKRWRLVFPQPRTLSDGAGVSGSRPGPLCRGLSDSTNIMPTAAADLHPRYVLDRAFICLRETSLCGWSPAS